jgi:hypothetical protein
MSTSPPTGRSAPFLSRHPAVSALAAALLAVLVLGLAVRQRAHATQSTEQRVDSLVHRLDRERDTVDVVFDRPAADDAEYRDDLKQAVACLDRYDATLVALRAELTRALATPWLGTRRAALQRARAVAELRGRQSVARRRMALLTLRFQPSRHRHREDLDLEQRMLQSDVDALEEQVQRLQGGGQHP